MIMESKKKHVVSVSVLLFLMFWSQPIWAQSGGQDFFQAIGKMYVVIAVIAVLFLGLMGYLFSLDKRISKLENLKSDGEEF